MSPEYNNQPKQKSETRISAEQIALELTDRYEKNILTQPNQICAIEPDQEIMAKAVNNKAGVVQNLMCIIKAGNDFFSVIKSSVFESENPDTQEIVLARHIAGDRSEFICAVGAGDIAQIGRGLDSDLDRSVSRKHFAITQSHDGVIGIADLNSTNHTEVFYPKLDNSYEIDGNDKDNPVVDFNFWSVKSSILKDNIR